MRKIAVMDTRTIVIGRVGENEAAQVVWPGLLAKWRGLYGEGTVQLAVRRALDKSPYPAVCAVDGDDVTWTVSAADTAQHGTGECELSYLVGDVVAKSQTWATLTLRSLTGEEPGEPPEDPAKAWFAAIQSQIGDLADLTTKAKDNLVAAINEAAKSGSGGGGSVEMRVADGYIQYSTDGETWENLIAVADLKGDTGPQGPKGDTGAAGQDGYSPSASVAETDDGAEISIIDKTGTTTATVKNGKDGAAGAAGSPGKDGVTPNIQIGTVTTLDAGSDATASMTGTAAEPLLNLGIPKGADGGPGSGDDMELIADVTSTDETNMILIDKDSDGNALKIRRYAIRITIPAHERTSRATFYVRCFSYGGGLALNNMLVTDGTEISFAIAQIMDTMQPPIVAATENIKVGCVSSRGANYFEAVQGFIAEPSVVQVYTNSADVMFPAGINVKVYGVRE